MALHLVSGLEQVLRHRQAHVAEADETDRRHAFPPSFRRLKPGTTGNDKHRRIGPSNESNRFAPSGGFRFALTYCGWMFAALASLLAISTSFAIRASKAD